MTFLVNVTGYSPIICRTLSGANETRHIIIKSGLFAWITTT